MRIFQLVNGSTDRTYWNGWRLYLPETLTNEFRVAACADQVDSRIVWPLVLIKSCGICSTLVSTTSPTRRTIAQRLGSLTKRRRWSPLIGRSSAGTEILKPRIKQQATNEN